MNKRNANRTIKMGGWGKGATKANKSYYKNRKNKRVVGVLVARQSPKL